jgi:hypothetical protein
MYTTMAFVALTLGNLSGTANWQNDYRAAMQQVSASGKPMIVFVGQSGPQSVVREGAFSPQVSKLLSEKFVCLYVDTSKASGQSLAQAFQVNKGIVISDRTGASQAFSLAGDVSGAELAKTLVAYADADPKDVKKTDTVVKDPKAVVVVVEPAGNCGTGCCGKSMSSGCGTSKCCFSFCCNKGSSCGTTTSCGTSSGCGTKSSGCCGWSWGCGSKGTSTGGCSTGFCCK